MGVHTGDSVTVAPQMTLSDEAYQELRDAVGRDHPRRRRRDRRLEHPVRPQPRDRRDPGDRDEPARLALVGARLEGDGLPDRQGRGEARRRLHARRDPERPHEDDAGELRADARLRRRQVPALRLREVPRCRPTPRHADEVGRRGDGHRADVHGGVPEGVRLARARSRLADALGDARRHPRGRASVVHGAARPARAGELGVARHPGAPSAPAGATTRSARRGGRAATTCAARATPRASGRRTGASTRAPARSRPRSNYYYSTWGEEDEALPPATKPRVVIIGSGPNRIGQGIEFDYCCVHAVQTFRALGYEAVMINCNPETVSTDYDTSDRLYFEPLSPEEVLAVLDREQPDGVVTQFGGQTPLRLARHIEAAGYTIMGTPHVGDRPRRGSRAVRRARRRARRPLPAVGDRRGRRRGARRRRRDRLSGARAPVLRARRPGDARLLRRRPARARRWKPSRAPCCVDRFVENAIEIDVDALCDGEDVYIAAVMQHVEEAGVHSGDSACVLPAQSLTLANALEVEHIVKRLGACARRGRAAQRPARDRRLDRLRARGEPARLAHGALRLEGDRDQPRRGRLQARRRPEAARSANSRRRVRRRSA